MAQIAVAGAGNANENINLINPRFQAEALRQIRGYDVGVLKNTFFTSTSATGTSRTANPDFMWKLNTSGGITAVRVGRGMATAYGYDIQSEAEVTLAGTIPASGTKYVFVYLEWDLHNPNMAVGSIKLRDNGTSSSWTPSSQNNLITNPTGIYQMILYRLTVNASGTITATANWENFGVKTIGYNLRSEHANHAENADEATHAGAADKATYAGNNTSAGTIDARIVDICGRLDKLGFSSGAVTFCGTSYSSAAKRQGNYVVVDIQTTRSLTAEQARNYLSMGTSPIITLPAGFRPKTAFTFYTCFATSGREDIGQTFKITVGTDGKAYSALMAYSSGVMWGENWIFKIRLGFEAPPR